MNAETLEIRAMIAQPKTSSLKRAAYRFSRHARAKRAAIFRARFSLTPTTRILDLGGGDGAHIQSVLSGTDVKPENVHVADVASHQLAQASKRGFQTIQLTEEGLLPFEDQFFDVVFCSSVIEHVTTKKDDVWHMTDERFARKAIVHQRAFADEIRRISKSFWVQTPARSFPFETHSWLPFAGWLSRKSLVKLSVWARKHWISKHPPDYHLLTRGHMETLFPDAQILRERCLGLTKSWIAVLS